MSTYMFNQYTFNNGKSLISSIRGTISEEISSEIDKYIKSWNGSYDLNTFVQTSLSLIEGHNNYLIGYFQNGETSYIYVQYGTPKIDTQKPKEDKTQIKEWIKGGFQDIGDIDIESINYIFL